VTTDLGELLGRAATYSGPLACDTETDEIHWWRANVGVVSFAWGMGPDEQFATRNVGPAQAALQYRMDNGLTTVFHNSPFDLHCLEQRGLRVNWNTVQDTLLMARLANNLGQHDLGALGETVLGVPRDQKDVVKAWLAKNSRTFQKQYGRKPNFLDVPDDTLLPYAAHDTALTIGLYYALIGQCPPALLQKEMRLREEMFKAERAGVEIDPLLVNQKLMQVKAEQGQIDQMLEYQYGGPVKPDSDAFLRDWLFKQLKLNPVGFTEGGQPQVNEYSLTSNPHPVTRLIIAHNKRVKGAEFFQSYLDLADGTILHPTINTLQARTARFSCSEPNLQQIPTRNDRFKTREVFHAGTGWFIGADYNKQEILIAACEAGEKVLIADLVAGKDVYVDFARAMLGKQVITPSERQAAKVAVLSMIYGAGAPKIAESFTVNTGHPYTVDQAKQIRANFKAQYPGLAALMDRMQTQGREQGFLMNRWGRKLYVEKDRAYVATDYLVQSSGRDVMADALLAVGEWIPQYGGRLMWPIHDEVLLYVPEKPTPELLQRVAESMVCRKFDIPLTAEPHFGKRMSDLK
jgi:DNA polymerase-1